MNDKQRARFERFRGALIDRARQLTSVLLELERVTAARGGGQRAGPQDAPGGERETAARELHTLKGEARLLGLAELAEVSHAAEERLERAGGPARIVRALDVVLASLEGRFGDEEGARRALAAEAVALRDEPDEQPPALTENSPPAGSQGPAPAHGAQPADPRGGGAEGGPPQRAIAAISAASHPALPVTRRLHVDVAEIDQLCDGLAEFIADFRALRHQIRGVARSGSFGRHEAIGVMERFDRAAAQLDELAEQAWRVRLILVEPVLQDLARHARELAIFQGKRLTTQVSAAGAQLERAILDTLGEPLLHIIRNAVDHGAEEPAQRGGKPPDVTLCLRAEQLGPNVVLTISDDGAGIEPERVRAAAVRRGLLSAAEAAALDDHGALDLLFRQGFSTRDHVTEVSGRGVGLAVVRSTIERLGGTVHLESEPGRGTRFRLEVPATIGKERVLVVDCAGGLHAIPSRAVRAIERIASATPSTPLRAGALVPLPDVVDDAGEGLTVREVRHGDSLLPLRRLEAVLDAPAVGPPRFALIVEAGARRWAFAVPSLLGEYELVRRPVDALLSSGGCLSGASALDGGQLALILSVSELIRRSGQDGVAFDPTDNSALPV